MLKSDYARRMLIDSTGEPGLVEGPDASGSDKMQKMCGLVQGAFCLPPSITAGGVRDPVVHPICAAATIWLMC